MYHQMRTSLSWYCADYQELVRRQRDIVRNHFDSCRPRGEKDSRTAVLALVLLLALFFTCLMTLGKIHSLCGLGLHMYKATLMTTSLDGCNDWKDNFLKTSQAVCDRLETGHSIQNRCKLLMQFLPSFYKRKTEGLGHCSFARVSVISPAHL